MYDTGDGVPRNEAAAVEWYRRAADQGNPDAQVNLGLMYLNGTGVAKNESAALHCFRMAAEQGHPKAQFNLGALLYNGVAGEPPLAEVYQWWTLAALQGHPSAQQNLEVVARRLGPEQLAAAQAAWPTPPAPGKCDAVHIGNPYRSGGQRRRAARPSGCFPGTGTRHCNTTGEGVCPQLMESTRMSTKTRAASLLAAMTLALAGQAQASLLLDTAVTALFNGSTTTTNTLGNDLPNPRPATLYFGQLKATANGFVDFFYVGNEAAYTNTFNWGNGQSYSTAGKPDVFTSPHNLIGTLDVLANTFLDFGFCTERRRQRERRRPLRAQ